MGTHVRVGFRVGHYMSLYLLGNVPQREKKVKWTPRKITETKISKMGKLKNGSPTCVSSTMCRCGVKMDTPTQKQKTQKWVRVPRGGLAPCLAATGRCVRRGRQNVTQRLRTLKTLFTQHSVVQKTIRTDPPCNTYIYHVCFLKCLRS